MERGTTKYVFTATGVTGSALTPASGVLASCPGIIPVLKQQIVDFVDANVYKKAAVKPKE